MGAGQRERILGSWPAKVAIGVVALFLFVLALQLMKESAGALGPLVRDVLRVDDEASALGFGWLAAYFVMGGSPIAAMSLTFFVSGVFSDLQTFVAIAGSRLGASFIVLLVGIIYHLRGHDRVTSLQMGVLSLLVTYTVHIPSIPIGFILLRSGWLDELSFTVPGALGTAMGVLFDPIVLFLVATLPLAVTFIIGLGLIMAAFNLFDRALPQVSEESPARDLQAHVFRPAVMFAIGFGVTLLTLSVSVSLGILVPLSAKGIARRENIIPYIMGANVSTFVDTLFAAFLLGAPGAFTIVLVAILGVGAVSLAIILLVYEDYERLVLNTLDLVLRTNKTLAAFMVISFVLPLVLIIV